MLTTMCKIKAFNLNVALLYYLKNNPNYLGQSYKSQVFQVINCGHNYFDKNTVLQEFLTFFVK